MACFCMLRRVSWVSRQEGDSSTTFWLRRCTEHSRSGKATTLPNVSATTWISMWWGSSIKRSINMRSSPKELLASALLSWKPSRACTIIKRKGQGAGSREQGAGSREQGANSTQNRNKNKN
jgi:hypothetical protein